jgi:hypothetical protein
VGESRKPLGGLSLDEGQEHFEAAIHAKPLGGENFAAGK